LSKALQRAGTHKLRFAGTPWNRGEKRRDRLANPEGVHRDRRAEIERIEKGQTQRQLFAILCVKVLDEMSAKMEKIHKKWLAIEEKVLDRFLISS
jgi:hypothetical protein